MTTTTQSSRSSSGTSSSPLLLLALPRNPANLLFPAPRYISLQEEYIKDEQRSLKRELVRAQEEIKRIQSVPLVIGQFMEAIDQKCVPLHLQLSSL